MSKSYKQEFDSPRLHHQKDRDFGLLLFHVKHSGTTLDQCHKNHNFTILSCRSIVGHRTVSDENMYVYILIYLRIYSSTKGHKKRRTPFGIRPFEISTHGRQAATVISRSRVFPTSSDRTRRRQSDRRLSSGNACTPVQSACHSSNHRSIAFRRHP